MNSATLLTRRQQGSVCHNDMSEIKENGVEGTSKNSSKEEDPKVRFKRLYKKAKEMGVSEEDFNKINAIKEIKEAVKTEKYGWVSKLRSVCLKFFILLLLLTSSVIAIFVFQWPVQNTTLVRLWFLFSGSEAGSERVEVCAVDAVDYMAEVFRPPTSCDFCRNVTLVEKLEHVSPEHFEKVYAYSSVPVVITDGTRNWSASKVFSYEFFKTLYSKGSPALQNVEENCQFFPYKTNFSSLEEVFDMDTDRALMKDGSRPWYIGW